MPSVFFNIIFISLPLHLFIIIINIVYLVIIFVILFMTGSISRHVLQWVFEQEVEHTQECPECRGASLWLQLLLLLLLLRNKDELVRKTVFNYKVKFVHTSFIFYFFPLNALMAMILCIPMRCYLWKKWREKKLKYNFYSNYLLLPIKCYYPPWTALTVSGWIFFFFTWPKKTHQIITTINPPLPMFWCLIIITNISLKPEALIMKCTHTHINLPSILTLWYGGVYRR